jgi:hypothetical protein
MADTTPASSQDLDIVVIEMHTVRDPAVWTQAPQRIGDFHRSFAELLQREVNFAARLPEVHVKVDVMSAGSLSRFLQ